LILGGEQFSLWQFFAILCQSRLLPVLLHLHPQQRMKILLVLFAFCAAFALAQDGYEDTVSPSVSRLPPDLIVTISDDRDSVPAGFEFQYEFVVKNIRSMAQSATGVELTIDFDNALTIVSIDYRCMQVEQDQNSYSSDNDYEKKRNDYGYDNSESYDNYDDGSYQISKDDNVFTCYLGRVSALGTQVVLATVSAPHVNRILVTEADVIAQNEGQWVTDNNDDKEETAVFDDIYLNQFNRLQTIANRPIDPNNGHETSNLVVNPDNAHICRFGSNDEKQLETDDCYVDPYSDYEYNYADGQSKSQTCFSYNVSAWARCFGNYLENVQYVNVYKVCDCYSSSNQPVEFDGFICQCIAECPPDYIQTGGGCQIDSAEDIELTPYGGYDSSYDSGKSDYSGSNDYDTYKYSSGRIGKYTLRK